MEGIGRVCCGPHHVRSFGPRRLLREPGVEPAPERVKKTTWTEFLKTHWGVLTATDFFTVDVRRSLQLQSV
jgi:hypothetical protein